MKLIQLFASFLLAVQLSAASNCSLTAIKCPSPNFNFCMSESLASNMIIRCVDGCPVPGNCNDNLASTPPIGMKVGAYCWQESDTAGNAQCTFDCVKVTATNGSEIYPVGCNSSVKDTTGSASATSSSNAGSSTTSPQSTTSTAGAPTQTMMHAVGSAALLAIGVLPILL